MPDVPATLAVAHQGARVHRIGERLQVRDEKGHVLRDLPFFRVGTILLMGGIEITNAAVSACFQRGVDVVYLTREGRFKGRLGALGLSDARLRVEQYRAHQDTERALAIARPIVRAKVRSGRVLLMRRQRLPGHDLVRAIQAIALLADSIPNAESLDELRGLEGSCARHHFQAMRATLKQDLGFERRVRRPPKDPVNALLSFGYTVLFHDVLSAVRREGLDPYLGHLHALENDRPSLALDLMEELRPIVVDAVVIRLVNEIAVTARDFATGPEGQVTMHPPTVARFIKPLHDRMATPIHHPASDRSAPIREAILLQVSHYKDVLMGRADAYRPLEIR